MKCCCCRGEEGRGDSLTGVMVREGGARGRGLGGYGRALVRRLGRDSRFRGSSWAGEERGSKGSK